MQISFYSNDPLCTTLLLELPSQISFLLLVLLHIPFHFTASQISFQLLAALQISFHQPLSIQISYHFCFHHRSLQLLLRKMRYGRFVYLFSASITHVIPTISSSDCFLNCRFYHSFQISWSFHLWSHSASTPDFIPFVTSAAHFISVTLLLPISFQWLLPLQISHEVVASTSVFISFGVFHLFYCFHHRFHFSCCFKWRFHLPCCFYQILFQLLLADAGFILLAASMVDFISLAFSFTDFISVAASIHCISFADFISVVTSFQLSLLLQKPAIYCSHRRFHCFCCFHRWLNFSCYVASFAYCISVTAPILHRRFHFPFPYQIHFSSCFHCSFCSFKDFISFVTSILYRILLRCCSISDFISVHFIWLCSNKGM